MGVVIRTPANRKISKEDCRCFLFPKERDQEPNYLCFREGVVGALTNEQEGKLCTERSFVLEKEGGLAKDSKSEEVRNILRTVERFSKGVHNAVKVYDDSGKRDIPYWRDVVRSEVNKLPSVVHEPPAKKHEKPPQEAESAEKPQKRGRKPLSTGRSAQFRQEGTSATTVETPHEGRKVITPEEQERELQARMAKYTRQPERATSKLDARAELLDYRYRPGIEETFFPMGD